MSFDKLSENVIEWAEERKILYPENAPKQMIKVMEEVGETAGALLKKNEYEIKDGIGDILVTVIILARQLGYTPEECLEQAYNEIENRTGKTVDGVFVKDEK